MQKMFVADDEVGVVGTANMDYRSFYLHFECGVAFFRCSVIQTVKQDILKTMEISQEIHPNPEERILCCAGWAGQFSRLLPR